MNEPDQYAARFLQRPLEETDPFVQEVIDLEEIRQKRKIILIPSESICPRPVRQALSSPFMNIYAEGYPPRLMEGAGEKEIKDLEWQLINYRRYADQRFYKGCEYVHEVEALAQRRAAECFATAHCPAESIHVNVQPLSGAAANNAVYEAFLEPGDLIMGMSLPHGGHLTHGSEFNRSGKRYRVVSYEVDVESERLDYEKIRRLSKENRPKLIVAGFTSYPWAAEWTLFREIADEAGAVLLADIAHPAGLVVAGQYPSPIGIADVVTFTTHKTLCGPRGAVIMTTDPAKAQLVDSAVFPGEQGGPHVNKMAAMAVAFAIARTDAFKDLQRRILENARALAGALDAQGVRICYGGTNTHLLVADLRKSGRQTGYPLMGEIAARILDLVGIVVNKNTIPGDLSAADARGIRLGTPWVTQRGMGREHMERIAEIIQRVLHQIHPFTYQGVSNVLSRGKIPIDLLEDAKRDVQELLETLDPDLPSWGYPNDHFLFPESPPGAGPSLSSRVGEGAAPGEEKARMIDRSDMGVLEVRGERAWAFLQEVCTKDLTGLKPGEGVDAFLLDYEARLLDKIMILRAEPETFFVLTHPSEVHKVRSWFRRLSEGYVLFDPEDILIKVQGPNRVIDRNDPESPVSFRLVPILLEGQEPPDVVGDEPGIRVFGMCGQKRRVLLMDPDTAITKWDSWSRAGELACIGREPSDELSDHHKMPPDEAKNRNDAMTLSKSSPELFDLSKPYFVGLWSLGEAEPPASFEAFEPPSPPEHVRRSCLYHEHAGRAKKIAAFAGWEMPIWYSSIQDEHRSVRRTAGLFDVSHMGVFGVCGEEAAHFLDLVSTNYVRWLRVGESQYGYLLDAGDGILDDFMVYRVGYRQYLLVVNAANAEKDLAWLRAVAQGRVSLDAMRPALRFRGDVAVQDLKDPAAGEDALVNMALQGPLSLSTLLELTSAKEDQWRLKSLKKTEVARITLGDAPAWVARTGYTGEPMGFELLIHPDNAPGLWRNILDVGKDSGVVPVGLGARDSLRTDAGLPLYGHELDGPHRIDPIEAGFEGYVKLHKPFFVGRKRMVERSRNIQRRVIRFRLLHKGSRMLHPGDLVLHRRNQKIVGWVTSSAPDGEGVQVGMALVEARYARFDTLIAVIPQSDKIPSEVGEIAVGKSWPLHEEGVILTRFPERD